MINLRPDFFQWFVACVVAISFLAPAFGYTQTSQSQIRGVQEKVVKIYGSGGFANLHSYQTGAIISPDGLIVTVWSHVLDGKITVVNSRGKRLQAKFVRMDPITDLAFIKIEGQQLEHFDLTRETTVFAGQSVVGISNLFGIASKKELLSVMGGVVSTIAQLEGKSGAFDSSYKGDIIVVDLITNNPGAAGGVVVDYGGNLIGVIGKELKDKQTGLWLNFCLPVKAVSASLKRITSQQSVTPAAKLPVADSFQLGDIGLELVPNVLPSTRPFVDKTLKGSVARRLGFQPDDLIIFMNGQPVRTVSEFNQLIQTIDRDASFRVTVKRENKLVNITVSRSLQ